MKQRLCQYTKDDLTKCTSFAMNGSDFCYRHNPDISNEEKVNASSKGGMANSEPEFIETPLPEMKMENLRDVANSLADSINQVRAGKISPKTGGTLAYMSFVLYMIMDKAKAEEKQEKIDKLKAEGKYRPQPTYGGKHYFYKDEFFLDKDGNELIVEKDGSTFHPELKFKREKPCKSEHRKSKQKQSTVSSTDDEYSQRTTRLLNTLKEGMDLRKADDLKNAEQGDSS